MPKHPLQKWLQMFMPPAPFQPEALERAFLADYCQRFARQRQVAALLGLAINVPYVGWDFVFGVDDVRLAHAIDDIRLLRIGIILEVLPALLLSLHRRFDSDESYATMIVMITLVGQYGIYCRGLLLVPFPYDFMYFFMGMFIIQIYGFSLLRLRSWPIFTFLTITLLLAAAIFAWKWQIKLGDTTDPAERMYSWLALSFLVTVGFMGQVVGNMLERSERDNFERSNELVRNNVAIQNHNRHVETLNETLRQAIEQEAEKAQALIRLQEEMREEADRRSREKSQFLANAVHDLKQPLQAIGNALEPGRRALEHQDIDLARRMFELATTATDLMRGQLAGMLEISRLESGFLQAELSSFDVVPLMRNTLAQLADHARRGGVALRAPAASEALLVHSDPHFMERILMNLIGNGIKYRDSGKGERPWVAIDTLVRPESLLIEVADNGLGIEREHIVSGAIFQPFFQANNRRRESEKGVGLGLSIVQAMLRRMPNHTLVVHSEVGVGTRMVLEVPWADSRVRDMAVLRTTPPTPEGSAPDFGQLRGAYVLYVEDDDLVRASTCALFDVFGILYEQAASLDQVIRLVPNMQRTPDIVVSDYRLPEGSTAKDVIDLVREFFGPIPVLVVTGEVGGDELGFPARCLLRKPLSSEQLLLAIVDAVGNRQPPIGGSGSWRRIRETRT